MAKELFGKYCEKSKHSTLFAFLDVYSRIWFGSIPTTGAVTVNDDVTRFEWRGANVFFWCLCDCLLDERDLWVNNRRLNALNCTVTYTAKPIHCVSPVSAAPLHHQNNNDFIDGRMEIWIHHRTIKLWIQIWSFVIRHSEVSFIVCRRANCYSNCLFMLTTMKTTKTTRITTMTTVTIDCLLLRLCWRSRVAVAASIPATSFDTIALATVMLPCATAVAVTHRPSTALFIKNLSIFVIHLIIVG